MESLEFNCSFTASTAKNSFTATRSPAPSTNSCKNPSF